MTTSIPEALRGKRLVVVDVEGNGQQPPEIIEIAALPVDGPVGGQDLRSWLICPRSEISPLVTRKVHGISNADVADCPPWTDVAGEILSLLTDRMLVAHNASVERRILSTHLPAWTPPMVLDTLRLAKYVWPGLGGYALDKLTAHADLDTSAVAGHQHHRAGYDAWCAWQLLCVLLEHSDLDWPSLVKAAALPGFVPPEEPAGGLW
jgi:DNA polymerase III epsilon subunit-like protein